MHDGYFWISYYDLILDDVFYTIEATEKDTYKYNYHYDTTTCTSRFPLDTEDGVANVFKVSNDANQVLEAINVGFKKGNFDYTLKIYTKDTEMTNPEDGTEVLSQNVHTGVAGIHTIPLNKSIFMKSGTYFSIVIKFAAVQRHEIFYDYSSTPLNLQHLEDAYNFEYNEVELNQSWRHKRSENVWSDLNREFLLGEENGKKYGRNWRIRGLTNEAKIITFNAGGGVGEMAEQGIKVSSASTINLNAFTKEGATFRRWLGSDGNEYVDGDTITLTDDITLTADWLEISSVRAITPPTKLTYNYGENISLAGLRLRITYTDNTYEEFSYEELNQADFRVHNNPLNNQLASESNALDCSLIGVSYKDKRIEFDEIDGLAHDIANKFYPITINNTPDFTVPVTLVKNGPYGGTPLSIRNGEAWDMTNTYRYNLINKKSPVFLYNLNGNETFSMDILDFNSIIAGYYLGMGDNNKMIGYDTITDVEIPEGTIKGTQNAYGQITSQEPMSFYFRNNYVLLYIGRQDNNISFYQNFSGLLDSIEVNNMPNKRNYLVGERFDPTGLSINAKNYDGSTYKNKVFEYNDRYRDEFTFSPSLDEALTTAISEITVTFRGKTCTFPISVLENTADLVQVTFDYDDNGRIATVSIPRNSTVFAPNTPTKRGWNFLRWAVPPNYGVAFDFDTPITEDITLEACWMAKAYHVYFHDSLINHSALNHTYIVPFGDTLPLPPTATISFVDIGLNIPTGYSFDTWYDKVTETDVTQVTPDDSVESYNFFAKWRANTYQVSYNLQGVTATLPNNSFTKTYDTPATLIDPTNIPAGYEFLGWYKEPECTNSWDGQSDLTSVQDDDKTIYAKWRMGITYDANGHGTAPDTREIEGSTTFNLPNIEEDGYTFGGWYTSSTEFTDANFVGNANDEVTISESKTLYARWTEANYKIYYKNIDNSSITVGEYVNKTFGTNVVLTNPTKTGYTFDGWYKDNNTFNDLYDGTTDFTSVVENCEKEIFAKWTPMTYTLKFFSDDRATTPSNVVKTYGQTTQLPTLTGLKPGYAFNKWIVLRDIDASGNLTYWDMNLNMNYDINYYYNEIAHTRVDIAEGAILNVYPIYNVTMTYVNGLYNSNKTETTNLFCKHYGAVNSVRLFEPLNVDSLLPDNLGYTFDGYYEDSSFTNRVGEGGDSYDPTHTTLYAKWNANTYEVTYDLQGVGATLSANSFTKTYETPATLINPTNIPAGYEFLGWYKEQACINEYDGQTDLTKIQDDDKTIYAKWRSAVVFNVLHGGNDINATVPHSIEITGATTITLPNTTATGYTFGGWYRSATDFSDANRVGGYNDPANVDSPTTFYAKWTANQYTINYNTVLTDANISQNSVPKTYGTPITLHNPSREGYDFAGWYKNYNSANKTYSDPYDGSTDIINTNGGSTTIFAKWTAHTYTIKYNVNGIGTAPDDLPKTYGTPLTLTNPSNIPTGYTFDGWYSNSDLADANRYQGATDLTINNGVDVNVYARYKARITYNVNGHGSINPAYTDVVLNGNTVLPTLTNVAGFTFDLTNSWFENSNCEGASVGAAGSNYTVVEPKTLFAKWTENEYNIIYHNDDLQGVAYTSGYNKPTTRRYTEAKILPTSENINRVGYSFAGWWTSDGTTTGQWGSQLTTIAVNTAEDKDIYARWNEISYEVRFVTNGGTLQGFNNPSSRRYSESFALPTETEILKTGYHFLGWFEHADYTGGPVTQVAANTAETKTYYARWEINTYNITYHTNGGTLDGTEDTDRLYTESVNFPVEPHISRNNYIFKGWWTSDGITMGTWGNQVSNVAANTANDVEVWARWAASYTVSFNLDSSEKPATVVATNIPANQNIEQGFKAQAPTSTPTANGYEFLGWYTDTTWSTVFNFNNTTIEGNTTVYAKWHQVQTITFTFNMQGHGTQVDTQYVVENNRVVRPTNPTAVGYNFIRWYEGTDTSVAFDFTQVIPGTSANPRTLNALWDEIEYTVAYNLNGGTVAETLDTARLYHEAMQLPNNTTNPNNVTKNGFTFGGWYDNPAFNGQSYDNIPANTAENKQFYAKWNGIEYSITLNELGGAQPTTGAQSIPTSYVSGIGTSLPMDFRKNNVPIVGWYTGYDETTGNYSGTRYTSIGNTVIGNLVLYARYGTPLTITFNAGGGTGSMGNQLVYQGVPTAINSNQFRRSGYEFNGWRGSNGLSYSNGQTITITTNLSLTATWKKVPSGGGGGRGGGGGGGGGGGMALPKTEPAPTTTENAVAKPLQEIRLDISQIEWKFEITTNKFKMNINNNGQTTQAKNGFYTVNFVVTQKTNEIETKISASNTYYFDVEGNMVTGWVKTVENKWYFFENAKTIDEGKMIVGWKKIQNDWYYFIEDGSMLVSTTTPDGYTVGSDGKMM